MFAPLELKDLAWLETPGANFTQRDRNAIALC
jgi:hypothetical protein